MEEGKEEPKRERVQGEGKNGSRLELFLTALGWVTNDITLVTASELLKKLLTKNLQMTSCPFQI